MNLSVLCELLLCASCLWAASASLSRQHGWMALGFLLIGSAALLGAFNYAGVEQVKPWHQSVSGVSGKLALVLIAAGGALSGWRQHLLVLLFAAAMLLLTSQLVLVGNLLALLLIVWNGRSRWLLAATGSVLFVAAGLLVGTQGVWQGIARVDLFHLTLALAVVCWTLVLRPRRAVHAARVSDAAGAEG